MTEPPEGSPAARAIKRLEAFTRSIDDPAARHGDFNPWPLLLAEARLFQSDSDVDHINELVVEFSRLRAEIIRCDDEYEGPFARSPMQKELAARRCSALRQGIENGDGGSVLEAVACCATHGLVLPGWLSAEFVTRYQRAVIGVCKGWSDQAAFGPVFQSEINNIAGVRAAAVYAPWAYEVAVELLMDTPGRTIDQDFYADVGEHIGRSHASVFSLIKKHVESKEEAPLKFIRDGLAIGLDLSKILAKWQSEVEGRHLRSIGLERHPDGSLDRISAPKDHNGN